MFSALHAVRIRLKWIMAAIPALMRSAASASVIFKHMKCYTRTGDNGETCVMGCRVDKHDERIEALGAVDELNAFLGAACSFSENRQVKSVLQDVQNDLFSLGAELAGVSSPDSGSVSLTSAHVERLESLIGSVEQELPRQDKFIIPSGTQAAVMINIARAVARRAESSLVRLDRAAPLNPEILKYANRLSSLLHVLSRRENLESDVEERAPVYGVLK